MGNALFYILLITEYLLGKYQELMRYFDFSCNYYNMGCKLT